MSSEASLKKSTESVQNSIKEKPKKKSHYKDLFNKYFFRIFSRKLSYLYLSFIKDDIYLLSNIIPSDLLADVHTASFAYLDLSGTDPVFKELVKSWLGNALNGKDVCLRLDFFTQISNRYFGDKIIPGQEVLPIKGVLPPGKYPDYLEFVDEKTDYLGYQYPKVVPIATPKDLLTVAWDTSQGYTTLPISRIYKEFRNYLDPNRVDILPVDDTFPKEDEEILRGDEVYGINPMVGYDILDLNKIAVDKSELLIKTVSNRAITYSHYAEFEGVKVIITRPSNVLFPKVVLKNDHSPTK